MSDAWLIRAASAPQWGGGHVSRCRALGSALQRFADITFVLDDEDCGWRPRLQADGFAVASSISSDAFNGCVVDHYALPPVEWRALRAAAPFVAMLHDHGEPQRGMDLLLAPGLDPAIAGIRGTPALSGPAYALLDSRFLRQSPRAAGSVKRIVVTFGLRDSANGTSLALEALRLAQIDAEVAVVLGGSTPHRAEVEARLAEFAGEARLILDAQDMPSLLASADLVLGAGGVGLHERMALGAPSITLIAADNQSAAAQAAAAAGGTLTLGAIGSVPATDLAAAIVRLTADAALRAEQSARGRALVDGLGAERAAAALLQARHKAATLSASAGA